MNHSMINEVVSTLQTETIRVYAHRRPQPNQVSPSVL